MDDFQKSINGDHKKSVMLNVHNVYVMFSMKKRP